MTLQADVHSLSDHDLLIRVAVKVDAIEAHAAVLNTDTAAIKRDQYIMKGAIGMLTFIIIIGIPVAAMVWNNV